jgi:hypothetical protein
MTAAFCIHRADNVATLLAATGPGTVTIVGEASAVIAAREPIATAHKIAIAPIPEGGLVIKYGWPIGSATRPIAAGDWVHLHNLASNYDERSGTLDLHTGSPTDTTDAYV